MRKLTLITGAVVLALAASAGDARAAFHLMSITKVFPGSPTHPAAQYVELRMYFGGQNFVGGTSIAVYSAANAELGRFTFPGSVASGLDQATILIATAQAQALLNVAPDLTMTAVIPRAGGKICFEAGPGSFIDCVAWGNHPGSAAGGPQANVGRPIAPLAGIPLGTGLVRRLDNAGSPFNLEAADDRNDCAVDFRLELAAPRNNATTLGVFPVTCANGVIDGADGCDDGGTTSGNGCSATCVDEVCGDLVVNDTSEACEDGNTTNGDGCDNNCTTTACGNGIRTGMEVCDDGDLVSGDGCDANCTPTACGNGIRTGMEVCDDGNLTDGDGCDSNCTPTACGNGIVTMGEDCEPPNMGACDAMCQLPCVTPADCADTDPCTTNERCTPTGCMVDPTPIDDANQCTMDACGPGGVVHMPLANGTTCMGPGPERSLCVAGACVIARCGDGYTDPMAPGGAEQCDDGNTVPDDGCTNTCTLPRCGDGVTQMGEMCDDGNADDTDACTAACMSARCGDLAVQSGETCDDGNTIAGDGCNATCQLERCGDGSEQLGEECDDGNPIETDDCTTLCTRPRCGDGIVSGGEACDDGNASADDLCTPQCTPPADAAGCCDGGRDHAAGAVLLGCLVLAGVGRRRRRGPT